MSSVKSNDISLFTEFISILSETMTMESHVENNIFFSFNLQMKDDKIQTARDG